MQLGAMAAFPNIQACKIIRLGGKETLSKPASKFYSSLTMKHGCADFRIFESVFLLHRIEISE